MHKTAASPLVLTYAVLIVYASLYPFADWRDQGILPWSFLTTPLPKYWTGFDVTITKEGDIYARDLNQPGVQPSVLIDRLMLRDSSQMTFERREDALMRPQPEFRQPNGDFANGPLPVTVTPQALESSNVNPVVAVVRLIDYTRSFESQIRFIKEAKSLDESGMSMLKSR